jgi:hypothetical protein
MEKSHLIANASWLAGELSVNDMQGWLKREMDKGSLLTILLDVFVSER